MTELPDGGVPAASVPTVEAPAAPADDPEPIELLVQLAEEGEIEPWDIDIVEVTDKFLARLDAADIRTSARALFYASVLLRMKSDALLEPEAPAEPDEPGAWDEWDEPPPAADGADPLAGLERELDRRLDRKRARGTPQTLDELVHELREADRDSWWKESRTYDTSDSPTGFRRGTQRLDYHADDERRLDDEPTEADVTGTAHAEHIETVIDDVRTALDRHYDRGREEVLFAEVAAAGGSRVQTFLGVLFLAHRGGVRIEQDDLFGDLWISDAATATEAREAVAD